MLSDHSQAQMSLISSLSSASSHQMTATPLRHQHQPVILIVAAAAEGASSFDSAAQQNDLFADFVLDESFNIDFLLKNNTATTTTSHNSNNSAHNSLNTTSQSFSIESQMAVIESLNCLTDVGHLDQFDHLDQDFIQSLDVNTLLDEAEAAVIQSPSLFEEAMPAEINLEGDAEFQNLLDSIANEVSLSDDAAINSPSAEITYSHLAVAAMTPLTNNTMEEASSMEDSYIAGANPSVRSMDETSSWSFEDDASSSTASPSLNNNSNKSRRVTHHRQSAGSVSKVSKSKKESNKQAAERYRNKKQLEKLELFAECERDEERNKQLKAEIEEVQAELNFIKNLLVEALLAKKS